MQEDNITGKELRELFLYNAFREARSKKILEHEKHFFYEYAKSEDNRLRKQLFLNAQGMRVLQEYLQSRPKRGTHLKRNVGDNIREKALTARRAKKNQ